MSRPTHSDPLTYHNPFQNTFNNSVAYPSNPDPSITYHNPFENTIFNSTPTSPAMSGQTTENSEIYQRFTATGRPLPSQTTNKQTNWALGYDSAHSFGAAAPNLLPVRFTDSSIISVPVLPHAEPSQTKDDDSESVSTNQDPIKDSKSRSSRFSISSFRRKSSGGNVKKGKQDFVMREMTRAEYLKHYAKDDNGKYIGSEEPAIDCILNNDDDRVKWRRA